MKLGSPARRDWPLASGVGRWYGRLGSFRIIAPDGSGEILNPKLEILNKHEIRNAKLET